MNAPRIDASRAIDLSGLKAAAPAPAGASYVVGVDDRTFEAMLARSAQHPIVIEFTSPRANAGQLSKDLDELANEAQGKWLLGRVNIDQSPAIVQALGIQGVPMVVGALAGQLVPLFQGTRDKQEVGEVIGQLLQAAVANGITGRATPMAAEPTDDGEPDPRFAAADAALEAGDFATAVDEFDKILAKTPGDAEASAGRAQARLFVRLQDADPAAAAERALAEPDDVDAALAMADVELAGGDPEAAFQRLTDVVAATSGDDREKARVRLLELFETIGLSDPVVLKARRALMSALF